MKVYTTKFLSTTHDTNDNFATPACEEGSGVVLDYLDIDNPHVYNHLVDQVTMGGLISNG